jgi:predicted transcriptional regulator
MANLLTRKEIAALIGKTPNYVGMYVERKHLIEENKRIDTDHPKNRAFIAKFTTRAFESTTNKEEEEKHTEEDQGLKGKVNVGNIDYFKKQHEIKKMQLDIQLKKVELLKKKAKVLPLEFVIEWSGRNVRGAFGETINFGNSMIEQICNEIGAGNDIKLKYKKKFKQGFTELIKNGIKKQEPEAISYAEEYSYINKW